jgi:hypothetical protein
MNRSHYKNNNAESAVLMRFIHLVQVDDLTRTKESRKRIANVSRPMKIAEKEKNLANFPSILNFTPSSRPLIDFPVDIYWCKFFQ